MAEILKPGPEGEQNQQGYSQDCETSPFDIPEQNQNLPEKQRYIWLEEPQIFEPAEPTSDKGEPQEENSADEVSTPLDKKPHYPWGPYNPFFVRG